jgi:hypothetical protein
MTQRPDDNTIEIRRIVRMLDRTVEMAHDAELTGSLAERSTAAVRSYNTTVRHLIDTGQAPAALFAPLPDDANLTDVAVSSAQLAEYLRAGLPEDEQAPAHGPSISRNLNIGVIKYGGDSDELGEMIREHLAEWFGQAKPQETPAAGEQEASGAAGTPAGATAQASAEPAAGARRALPAQGARVEEMRTEGQGAGVRS